jgi:UDP-N-acetyl-D-glucosamine dehydrogenase
MKRFFDLVISLILLILLGPIMIVTAILIKNKLGNPILFKQVRPGKQGKLFTIYKFRTMTNKVGKTGKLLPDEQRITTFGKFLRKTSIDELPQLFNVIKGDLSLVGPRPLLLEYLPRYNAEQKRRHEVKPGITGWAQVNGRNAITWEEKFKLDVWYVDNQSFLLDLKILWITIKKVFISEGITQEGYATMPAFMGDLKQKEENKSIMKRHVELIDKIKKRKAIVGIIGLGYVGLPLAIELSKQGFKVLGIDHDKQKVDSINNGISYITDIKDEDLKEVLTGRKLKATTSYEMISHLDVIIICVPTPLTKNLTPNLKFIEDVTEKIEKNIKRGQLICLESTTFPGTTEEVCLPILEKSSLKVDQDFYLAHTPERVDVGNKAYSITNTTKVIGGVGEVSTKIAKIFYEQIINNVITVSNAKTAELVKIYENTFRAVNIALVNELTFICDKMDLNVWEALDAAYTKPFGIMPFYPGPGVGGHCIPIDPHYLEWKAKEFNINTRFISLAGEINRKMPEYVRNRAIRILSNKGIPLSKAKVMIVGVAYKKNTSDHRGAPAVKLMQLLQKEKATVSYHDHYVPHITNDSLKLSSTPLTVYNISKQDIVIICNDHSDVDYQMIVENASVVFDTKNVTKVISDKNLMKKVYLL